MRMITSKEGQMTIEDNKAMVMRFFEELLDKENVGILNDLFTERLCFSSR